MATATLQHPSTEHFGIASTARSLAPLLVATDATTGSDAALRAARAVSARTGACLGPRGAIRILSNSFESKLMDG